MDKVGRRWFDLTDEDIAKGRTEESILAKCQEVWAIDGTDAEASSYANISASSICRYLDAHPEQKELRNRLKEKPILKARQEVIKGLNNYQNAMDYLKRKKRTEFGDSIDHTTKNKEIKPLLGGMSNGTDNTINNEATKTEQED